MKSQEFKDAGVMPWSELRALIATGNYNGDCLVWDGDSFISNSISVLTGGGKNGLSHASLLGYLPAPFDSVVVAESNFTDRQLVFRSMTDKLIHQHGTAYWIPTTMTQEQRAIVWDDVARRELRNIKYDSWGLVEYAAFALFPHWFKGPKLHEGAAFCSAVCQWEWMLAKYIVTQQYAWCPEDIPTKLMIKPIRVQFDKDKIDWR